MAIVFLLNSFVVLICVTVHYELLYRMTLWIPKMNINHRYRIIVGVIGCLVAHAIEIWVFAVVYFLMGRYGEWGFLDGNVSGTLLDCGYFSFTVFTTLGFGDIYPVGEIRYLTGIESLTGLVLITWTASFLFYEMQRHWGVRK